MKIVFLKLPINSSLVRKNFPSNRKKRKVSSRCSFVGKSSLDFLLVFHFFEHTNQKITEFGERIWKDEPCFACWWRLNSIIFRRMCFFVFWWIFARLFPLVGGEHSSVFVPTSAFADLTPPLDVQSFEIIEESSPEKIEKQPKDVTVECRAPPTRRSFSDETSSHSDLGAHFTTASTTINSLKNTFFNGIQTLKSNHNK